MEAETDQEQEVKFIRSFALIHIQLALTIAMHLAALGTQGGAASPTRTPS